MGRWHPRRTDSSMMKIYLAGELSSLSEHWRYQLTVGACERPKWDFEPVKKAILGAYHYTGPFPRYPEQDPEEWFRRRVAAIRCSDLVFSWLPDQVAAFEVGVAIGAGVKAAVAAPSGFWETTAADSMLWGATFYLSAVGAGPALVEAIKKVNSSEHYFNGVWRKMVGKFGGECKLCGDRIEPGEDIMWRKESDESRSGEVCHLECFLLNAPARVMDEDLQAAGMEVLRNRVRKLEEDNRRLMETVQDLA